MIEVVQGILIGFLVGLFPGIHVNSVVFFFSESYFLVIPMSVSFVFSSFFPSILLGVPSAETALSVLPGHRLVLKGKALTALNLCFYSCMVSAVVSIAALAFFCFFLPSVYPVASKIMPYALMLILAFMILTDRKEALIIVALAGILGIMTFNFNLLTPLLSGFFALSTLIVSLESSKTPPQELVFNPKGSLKAFAGVALLSSFLSSFFSMIPAVSSSITATAANSVRDLNDERFLFFLGSTNFNYMAFSFYTMHLAGIYRSGSAAFLSSAPKIHLFQIAGLVLISSFLSGVLCIALSGHLVSLYRRVNYRKACIFSMAFIITVNFAFAGFFGLVVLFASTFIGLSCVYLNVRRINCMSALIVPVIL